MADINGSAAHAGPKHGQIQRDDSRRRMFKERSKGLERGTSAPLLSPDAKAPLPLSAREAVGVGYGKGHEFAKKTFFQPTFCHHCTELLWGLTGQGMKCSGAITFALGAGKLHRNN